MLKSCAHTSYLETFNQLLATIKNHFECNHCGERWPKCDVTM